MLAKGQKLVGHTKQPAIDARKTALKEQFERQQKQLVIELVIKFLIKLQTSEKHHHRIVQRKLKVKQKQEIKIYTSRKRQQIIEYIRLT